MTQQELLELARAKAARWSVENDGITGHCVFTWRKYLETAYEIIKLTEAAKHTTTNQEQTKMANGSNLADAVFSAYENTPLNNEPLMDADRLGVAAALEALAVNADWEAEDPKFMVLRIAEQIKNDAKGLTCVVARPIALSKRKPDENEKDDSGRCYYGEWEGASWIWIFGSLEGKWSTHFLPAGVEVLPATCFAPEA